MWSKFKILYRKKYVLGMTTIAVSQKQINQKQHALLTPSGTVLFITEKKF